MISIIAVEDKCIKLGKRGEHSARVVQFDISHWVEEFGLGEVLLVAKRYGDMYPYSVPVTQEDHFVLWVVTSADVDSPGYGECELIYIVDNKVVKSTIYQTYTEDSLSDPVSAPDSPNTFASTNMKIGNLNDLSTEDKTSLVRAINEIKNILGDGEIGGGVGENVSGTVQTPYTVDEAHGYVYIYDDPIIAGIGAEILNSYSGDTDRNIAVGNMSQASGYRTQALGDCSTARGWWTKAATQCSTAEGLLSIASGNFSHAEGTRTKTKGNNAHSEGDGTIASGGCSHSEGSKTESSGQNSHAEGLYSISSGLGSHAEGYGTIASGQGQTAMGKHNIADTSSRLIVGKGSSSSNRSNAFTVSSAGNGWFAGTVTSTGADYAELFEWVDGNPNAEDRIGLVVTLEGDKIRLANDGDDILGIISGTAMVLGDNAMWEWKDKYLTDDYGRIIYDEPIEEFVEYIDYVNPNDSSTWKTVKKSTGFHIYPKLNPDYDPNREYISRENRKEWDAVGMIGKLYANDDNTCTVGGYAKVSANGILTHSNEKTNLRVMKRIADGIVFVLKA